MKKDFIPGSNSSLNTFVRNFLDRLDKHSGDLSMNRSETEESKDVLKKFMSAFSNMISKKAESKAATEEFYIRKKECVDTLRRMSNRVRASQEYSKAIGKSFKIVKSYKKPTDFSKHKPALNIKSKAKHVIIRFTKKGTDGIKLYSRRGNEKEFSEIAYATRGMYTDKRSKLTGLNPEVREYCAEYVVKYKSEGKRSNIVKVIVP